MPSGHGAHKGALRLIIRNDFYVRQRVTHLAYRGYPLSRSILTDIGIKLLKPKGKPYKVSGGTDGCMVAVSVAGEKVF